MYFSKIGQILFIVGSTSSLLILPECLNNSWWCFSSKFSDFEDRRRVSLKSCPFSWRFMVLAWCHPLIIVFDCENSFHPSGAIHESFQFDSPKAIISEDLFVLNIQLSFSKSYRYIVQISSNQFMISSFHLYLNSFKYLRSFSNSSRCFFIFSSFIFNSYGGSFKSSLPWLSYQFIRSFQSYRRIVEEFSQVYAISLS